MATGSIAVRIEGEFACFTRPEMKVERVSYEVITPSAARGVLEAVLWKPQMRWIVERLVVLAPPRFIALKRNEVNKKIPMDRKSGAGKWALDNSAGSHAFFADEGKNRAQRNTLALRDVDYLVTARVELTDRAEPPDDNLAKYTECFRRRVKKGQHFHQPYLGCREFPATVTLASGQEQPHEELVKRGEVDLGQMLLDIEYRDDGSRTAHFFPAIMHEGAIDVPRPDWLPTPTEEARR